MLKGERKRGEQKAVLLLGGKPNETVSRKKERPYPGN
jgi:hypothetical protein